MVITYPEPKSIADVLNDMISRIEKLESLVSKKK